MNKNKLKLFVKKQLKTQINDFDFSISNLNKILNYINIFKGMLLLFIIYDNKMYIINNEGDSRKKIIIDIVIKYFKKNKNTIKNTILPFFVSDSYFYHDNNIPMFIEAKPFNKKGILIPDTSFYKVKIGQNKNFITYNNFKNNLLKIKCSNYKDKKPIIYFKGANTGADKHNIRMKLKEIVDEKNDKNYLISISEKFVPMYEYCKYKYLLNLPGHQPWSNRLMKISTMKSLIIDINVRQSYNGKEFNEKWIMIYEQFFKKNKDFIQIDYDWIEGKTKNTNVYNLYNQINEIYNFYEKNEKKFKKIVDSCYEKAELITIDFMNETYDLLFDSFIKKLYSTNKKKDIDIMLQKFINFNTNIVVIS